MSKIDVTIPFEDEKLEALTLYLRKKNTTPLKELAKALSTLYEQAVPQEVREYIDSRCAPPSRPKPKPAPKPTPKPEPPKEVTMDAK